MNNNIMTYNEFRQIAKGGEKIILGGLGIIDGLKYRVKSAVYTAVKLENGDIWLRPYRSKSLFGIKEQCWGQLIEIITNDEFRKMSIY